MPRFAHNSFGFKSPNLTASYGRSSNVHCNTAYNPFARQQCAPNEIAAIINQGNPYDNDTVSLFAISLVGDPIRPINVNADPVIYIVRDDSTNPATHTLKIEPASGSLLAMDPPDPDWDINGKVPPRNG